MALYLLETVLDGLDNITHEPSRSGRIENIFLEVWINHEKEFRVSQPFWAIFLIVLGNFIQPPQWYISTYIRNSLPTVFL